MRAINIPHYDRLIFPRNYFVCFLRLPFAMLLYNCTDFDEYRALQPRLESERKEKRMLGEKKRMFQGEKRD